MNKLELCNEIIRLIEPETTPDPDNTSDGELLDIIYELVKSEIEDTKILAIREINNPPMRSL